MEFPDLGAHCYEKSCNRLDFLPMKCDACSYIFCNNHIQYSKHACIKQYEKDVQVPVCPLCNNPVPTKRGQLPDLEVEQHILRDCLSDPAVSKRKVYTNKCSMKGCKQKEVVPVMCSLCRKNYCLKHRHTTDHNCLEMGNNSKQLSPAGAAALARVQNLKNEEVSNKSSTIFSSRNNARTAVQNTSSPISSFQAGMSEDEALAFAMQQSMLEINADSTMPKVLQEKEDRLLAEALAASEKDTTRERVLHGKDRNCTIS